MASLTRVPDGVTVSLRQHSLLFQAWVLLSLGQEPHGILYMLRKQQVFFYIQRRACTVCLAPRSCCQCRSQSVWWDFGMLGILLKHVTPQRALSQVRFSFDYRSWQVLWRLHVFGNWVINDLTAGVVGSQKPSEATPLLLPSLRAIKDTRKG